MNRYSIFGLKNKGGAKLSVSLNAIATVLRATGAGQFEVHVVDSDAFNASLYQRLGERDATGKLLPDPEQSKAGGVLRADLFKPEGIAPLFEAVESDARYVIIDTPAGGLSKSDKLTDNLSARDFVRHNLDNGRQPLVFVPFGPEIAGIRGVKQALDRFEGVQIVAMRSMVNVEERDYRLWSNDVFTDQYGRPVGGQTRAAFEDAGGRLISIPALTAGSNAMAEALHLSFAQAARYRVAPWQTSDQLNVKSWLGAWVRELQSISDILGLADADWKAF